MNYLAILPLLLLALADDIIRAGAIYITQPGSRAARQNLIIECDKIFISNRRSVFEYEAEGKIKQSGAKKYLSVNDVGGLVLDCKPQAGFTFTSEQRKWQVKRKISYNGDEMFQLCGDDSIGYKSNCEGARNTTLTYVDLISPV